MLIQAKSKNEAKGFLILFGSAMVVNLAVFIHAFLNEDVITLIFCAVAGILALVLTIEMKTQLSTNNFNKHRYEY